MKEYICKEDIRNKLYDADAITMRGVAIINDFPVADVVPKSVLEQVMWERDTAIEQLGEIGKGLGEKMDDVRLVVLCKDCNYYRQSSFVDKHMECARSGFPVYSVGFCPFGEKKEKS